MPNNYRIRCLYADWKCYIRFRDYDDAYGYARRKMFTRDYYGGVSRFTIVKVDEFGNENSFDRWEI